MQEQGRLEKCAGLPTRVLGDHGQAAENVGHGLESQG